MIINFCTEGLIQIAEREVSNVTHLEIMEVFLVPLDVSVFFLYYLQWVRICYGIEAKSVIVLRLVCKSVKVVGKVCAYYSKYEKYAGVSLRVFADY